MNYIRSNEMQVVGTNLKDSSISKENGACDDQ